MMSYFNTNKVLGLLLASLTIVSCTTMNPEFGVGDVDSSQSMTTQKGTISNGIETYTIITDSIPSSSLGYMTLGELYTETMGWTKASSYAYINPYEDYFDAIEEAKLVDYNGFDSVVVSFQIYNVSYNRGESVVPQKFGIYQAVNFLPFENPKNPDNDGVYYSDIAESEIMGDGDIDDRLLFTFEHGDPLGGLVTFTARKVAIDDVTDNLVVTPNVGEDAGGKAFIKALLAVKKELYEFSNTESFIDFAEAFKGIYVAPIPVTPTQGADITGTAIYSGILKLDLFYTVESEEEDKEDDPKEPKALTYLMLDDAAYSQLGVSRVEHIYPPTLIDKYIINNTSNTEGKLTDKTFVQNMSGLGSYFVFTDDLCEQLEALKTVDGKDGEDDEVYSAINFNRALLVMNVADATDIPALNVAPYRLGMYYSYVGTLPESTPDYNYFYEMEYGQLLSYDGNLNRRKGRYEMDISVYLKNLLIDYAEKTEEIKREIIFAPAYVDVYGRTGSSGDFYDYSQIEIVGSGAANAKPQLELTYTLIK